ncbi:MAG TPA: glycosyl hydrolase family 28 protein [Candidatus Angelobacter sp.]|nr:glycosyl hydrolase family 28 protein [Candidatus Angelobacter sp.]
MLLFLIGACAEGGTGRMESSSANRVSIADFGAVPDGQTLNTSAIQSAIDNLAQKGGGTLVIPRGVFLSGAIFLKPGVNLYLDEGAVLKGSTNILDYPKMKTRIEGQLIDWIPALVNANRCDHLRISGSGALDGSGQVFYIKFWNARRQNPRVTNLAVERPRLVFIQNSHDVKVSGITFENSGFWNLHIYRCKNVVVENDRFEVPNGMRCPSTDGTDVDSCQYVTIRGCTYRVDDDCVCLKGSKGPFAMGDTNSPPVEHIRVENCTFERGGGVVTLGSEATLVRDVVVENCKVVGPVNVAVLKLRPDTPQHYEDIHYRNITLDGTNKMLINMQPWRQFFDLKGQPPPKSIVHNVTLSNIRGSYGTFGIIQDNPGQTDISDITLENINVQLKDDRLRAIHLKDFNIKNVIVNGKPFSLTNTTDVHSLTHEARAAVH